MSRNDIKDAAYARQREAEERAAAVAAASGEARNAHLAMADRYADRASSLDRQRPGNLQITGYLPPHEQARVAIISKALVTQFGDRAKHVAEVQAEAASDGVAQTWADIVAHISILSPPNEDRP